MNIPLCLLYIVCTVFFVFFALIAFVQYTHSRKKAFLIRIIKQGVFLCDFSEISFSGSDFSIFMSKYTKYIFFDISFDWIRFHRLFCAKASKPALSLQDGTPCCSGSLRIGIRFYRLYNLQSCAAYRRHDQDHSRCNGKELPIASQKHSQPSCQELTADQEKDLESTAKKRRQ